MKLIDPQPMETLPEKGWVFVKLTTSRRAEEMIYHVDVVRSVGKDRRGLFAAWSYSATTKGGDDGH